MSARAEKMMNDRNDIERRRWLRHIAAPPYEPPILPGVIVREPTLTDELMDAWLKHAESIDNGIDEGAPPPALKRCVSQIIRLVPEVRRLRSDDWLEKALTEGWKAGIDGRYGPEAMVMGMMPFLRRHRDAK